MEIRPFTPATLTQLNWEFLLQEEAKNSLLLGRLLGLQKDMAQGPESVVVELLEQGQTQGIALQISPHNLVLSSMSDKCLAQLGDYLSQTRRNFPGVVGPKETVQKFAQFWGKQTQQKTYLFMDQMIYQLQSLKTSGPFIGNLSMAMLDDEELVIDWFWAFHQEALASEGLKIELVTKMAHDKITKGEVYLLQVEGKFVSMACTARKTHNGCTINGVFTPKDFRKKGWASSCVAQLSQRLLDQGNKFCVLYTDLRNPTSNGIYQTIGYEPVCESQHYIFVKGS